MGGLHQGHLSLVERARADCDRVLVSIFVNPAQFGAGEDFERYPRPVADDLLLLGAAGVDAVYLPSQSAMYPSGFATNICVRGPVGESHEGVLRPGHFSGVALVVSKLLICARAHRAYFGQKDAQQCVLVRRLAADLDTATEIVVCPTVRDHDGLALSTRNGLLSASERLQAAAIPAALVAALDRFDAGERDAGVLQASVERDLRRAGLNADGVALVDGDSFEPAARARVGSQLLVLVRMSSTHLLDGVRLGVDHIVGAGLEGGEAGVSPSRTGAAGKDL